MVGRAMARAVFALGLVGAADAMGQVCLHNPLVVNATQQQQALDYCCGVVDCTTLNPGGDCYNGTATLLDKLDFCFTVFYYRDNKSSSCDFGGAAALVDCATKITHCVPCPGCTLTNGKAPPDPCPAGVPTPAPPPPPPSTPIPSAPTGKVCMHNPKATPLAITQGLVWACTKAAAPDGGGVDCDPINTGGSCFSPNTLAAHADYAFNEYYLAHYVNGSQSCDFGGAAVLQECTAQATACDPCPTGEPTPAPAPGPPPASDPCFEKMKAMCGWASVVTAPGRDQCRVCVVLNESKGLGEACKVDELQAHLDAMCLCNCAPQCKDAMAAVCDIPTKQEDAPVCFNCLQNHSDTVAAAGCDSLSQFYYCTYVPNSTANVWEFDPYE
eukprot:TRINITY_DN7788_c3_g1_i1.p1 TRINITY_DN7788_c3_g1~~TRINITY_DN7788_c3_g1_i1.p1  ORF type:complete len:384 (+),score=109.85 TRINITY_DN7788_c3_g1_i1:81-1232(+)